MKIRSILFTLLMLVIAPNLASAQIAVGNSCDQVGRHKEVCLQMRHLRSHIHTVDAQRDLLQVNYSLLKTLATGVQSTVDKISSHGDYADHTQGIETVKNLAIELETLATNNNPNALLTANQLRFKCSTCHSVELPSSSYSWETVFKTSWDKIIDRCNEYGRNPYACKHMFGLFSATSYFFTAPDAQDFNYDTAHETAKEINRISKQLQKLGEFHNGGNDALREVELRSEELMALASAKDPKLWQEGRQVTISCSKCHGN
jgi:hypothetical protein